MQRVHTFKLVKISLGSLTCQEIPPPLALPTKHGLTLNLTGRSEETERVRWKHSVPRGQSAVRWKKLPPLLLSMHDLQDNFRQYEVAGHDEETCYGRKFGPKGKS